MKSKKGMALLLMVPIIAVVAVATVLAHSSTNATYDDFGAGYDIDSYNAKWFVNPFFPTEPEALKKRSFKKGLLHLEATPFTTSSDDVSDHIKYLALSTGFFVIPQNGTITFSADIKAKTPGAEAGHVVPTTGRVLLEGQQAAATLHMINFKTGQLYDWFVSENYAFALYERLFVTGVADDEGYTQIVDEFAIEPGSHNYAIRYKREINSNDVDRVEYLIDGEVRATVEMSGIPLNVQDPEKYAGITYPSLGPAELLEAQMDGFIM